MATFVVLRFVCDCDLNSNRTVFNIYLYTIPFDFGSMGCRPFRNTAYVCEKYECVAG